MRQSNPASNESKGMWRRLFKMLGNAKLPYGTMLLALLLFTAKTILDLRVVDKLPMILDIGKQELLSSGILIQLFLILTGSVLLSVLGELVKNIALAMIDRNMQQEAVSKVLYLPSAYLDRQDPREFVSRITTDTRLISSLLLDIVINEPPRLYYMISVIITLFSTADYRLALLLIASIPVTCLGSLIGGRLIFKRADTTQSKISILTALLAEKVNNLATIKMFNRQAEAAADGDRLIEELMQANIRKSKAVRINDAIYETSMLIPQILIMVCGAVFVISGEISPAAFAAFFVAAGTFITYVNAHLTLWISVKTAQGATFRLSAILDSEDENTKDEETVEPGDIVFKDVCFSYGDHVVLDHVSFTIEKGKKTALVGCSGSGKSTVLNLIEQFYRPDSGAITIGEKSIFSYDVQSYRRAFTYLTQNAPGFSDTIRDFLLYGMEQKLSDDELYQALERLDADQFVQNLGGLDYELGNNAEKVSGGQRQKLAIIRALLSAGEYMLLDEATSALDVRATLQAQELLDEQMKGKTMILVAHNMETVKNADKIIVFSNGKIVGQGSHAELMKECAPYRSLATKEGGNAV